MQELLPNGLPQHRILDDLTLRKLAEKPILYRKIVFSNEVHFWLNGSLNKQNYRFWGEDQSEALQKLPNQPEKVTVSCGLWDGGIIEPYFFKDSANHNATVNDERYRGMIYNFFLRKMQELDLHDMRFQQNGATCHTARLTMDLLRSEFGEHFISRSGPV